jgi:hypothetical protein
MLSAARFAIVVIAMAAVPLAARAEIEIVSVKGASLTAGTKLPDDAVIDVPKGGEVRLLKLPGGAAYAIGGPFKGTLQDYIDRCSGWRSWFGSGCNFSGDGDELPVGGTRGLVKPE